MQYVEDDYYIRLESVRENVKGRFDPKKRGHRLAFTSRFGDFVFFQINGSF